MKFVPLAKCLDHEPRLSIPDRHDLPPVVAYLGQATQQSRAAGATQIEWHVAEEGTAKAIRNLFKREGIKGIDVIHSPAR